MQFPNYKNSKLIYFVYLLLIDTFFFLPVLLNKKIIGSIDAYNQFYPYISFFQEGLKNFNINLWWWFTALGYPFDTIIQFSVFYPINYLYFLLPLPQGYNIILLIHFYFFQIFTFLYIYEIFKKDYIALIGVILFCFNVFNLTHLDIYPFICSSPYFILSIYIFHKISQSNKIDICLIVSLGLVLGLEFLAGYPQLLLYNIITLIIFLLVILFQDFRKFKILLFNFLLSLLIAIPIILPQYLLSVPIVENSLRKFSKDFLFNQFSYPPYMLITYFFPHIFGGIGNIDYWGPDKEYFGLSREYINYLFVIAIPTTFLGIYGVIKYKKTNFYFFLVLAIISLILGIGKYTIFSYIFYFTPFYSDIRIPARNMFQFNLAISILSLLGMLYLIKIIKQKSKNYNFLLLVKKLIIIYTIFIFICLSFILLIESNNFVNLLLSLFFTLVLEYKLTIFFLLFLFVYVYLFYRFKYLQIGKITTLLVLILVLEKSFLYFSNNYFNLNIKKTEEIEKLINFPNLATKNFWQYHYFIPNLPESNLIATKEKIRVLNIYDPFVNIDYYYLFRIFWDSKIEYIYLYSLLRNNLLISTFGVNYITTLENIQKLQKINKVSYEDLQVKKIQDFDIYQKDKIISINFKEKLNTDFIILIANINKQKTKQNFIEKISKLVLEKREILTVNIGDVYTLNLTLDHIGHPIEKDNITLILPLPVNSKIKEITLNYFNTYNKIKIENIEIYAYPINTIPSLIPSKKQAAYIKINNNLTSLDNSLFSYINTNSLPFLFSVKKIKIISNIVEFKKLIFLFKINTKDKVTIEKDQILQIKKYLLENMNELIKNKTEKLDPENLNLEELDFYDPIIKNLKIDRNSVFVELYCPKISFIVINNSYHKNWKCYLNNNKEVPIFKANCIAQGLILPPGENNLEIRFEFVNPFIFYIPFIFIFVYLIFIFLLIKINKN